MSRPGVMFCEQELVTPAWADPGALDKLEIIGLEVDGEICLDHSVCRLGVTLSSPCLAYNGA